MGNAAPTSSSARAGRPVGIASLVLALGLSVWTVWLAFSPFEAYRELGPAGRRAPCGSAFRLKPGYEGDEVCFDVAQHRQYLVLVLGAAGIPLIVTAGLLLRPTNKDRG